MIILRAFAIFTAIILPGFAMEAVGSPPQKIAPTAIEKPAFQQAPAGGAVYVFPLKEPVSDTVVMFMRRSLKEAERNGASAFLIDMDTPGGSVDAVQEILDMLHKTKLPTLTFVNPNAISAGSLISLGTKRIYMRPDAVIGAAAIVSSQGEDLGKTMQLKADSFLTAKMRAVCEENGHNPLIAEAFMVPESELKIGDAIIDTKEKLLSLNGSEAVKIYEGKPLLAAGLVDHVEDLLKAANLNPRYVIMQPTGFERIALWITRLAPLLLLGGIICGYIEMKVPGFGLPGICSLLCFGFYFGGHFIAGLAGYETILIFVFGLALVIVEIFIMPGLIIPGLVGAMLIFGSLLWAMVDRWPSEQGLPSGVELQSPLFNMLVAFLGATVFALLLSKFLPKTSIYRRIVLSESVPDGPAISVPSSNVEIQLGSIGIATTTLRPAGKVDIHGKIYDVITSGEHLEIGAPIKVIEADGMRILVEKVR